MAVGTRYDRIGTTYRERRRPARLAARLEVALGAVGTVLNVGAGTGSYEPAGRRVIAVEPSAVMVAQRPATAAPAVRAVAEARPFPDRSFDAALAVLTVHHWADAARGLAEVRRVARRVVILSTDARRIKQLWLPADYFPGSARGRRPDIQPDRIVRCSAAPSGSRRSPVPRDCTDGFGEAFWARPEAYLDPAIRAAMSACSLLSAAEVEDGVTRLAADLESGRWDARHGYLRDLAEFDTGHRLIIAS